MIDRPNLEATNLKRNPVAAKCHMLSFVLLGMSIRLLGSVNISSQTEVVTISKDADEFRRHVIIEGFCSNESESFPVVTFNLFEKVSDLVVELKDPGQEWKKVKSKSIVQSDLSTRSFFDDFKAYMIHIPKDAQFRCSYVVTTSELMLLCSAQLFNKRCKAFDYTITVPSNKKLEVYVPSIVKEEFFTQDISTPNELFETVYHIKTGTISEEDRKYFREMRLYLLVHPAHIDPMKHFINWSLSKHKDVGKLDTATQWLCNSLLADQKTDFDKAKTLFSYVQQKIRYTAFESGYGAWIPRPTSVVCSAMRGDCKDMANLLRAMLQYAGVDAKFALIHSLDRGSGEVFPSLAAANHAICIATVNGQRYVLDATDEAVGFGLPSRHTQGRPYLILDDAYEIDTVPVVSASENRRETECWLKLDAGGFIVGSCSTKFNGLSGLYLSEALDAQTTLISTSAINEWYRDQSLNLIVKEGQMTGIAPNITANCQLSGSRTFTSTVNQKIYLNLSFLLTPYGLTYTMGELPIVLSKTVSDRFIIHLDLPDALNIDNQPELHGTDEVFDFKYHIRQNSDRQLTITYETIIDTLRIDRENYETYKTMVSRAHELLDLFLVLSH